LSIKELKCPKDGNTLVLVYESERLSGVVRVSIYYKCQVCGYRRDVEKLEISRDEQGVLIKRALLSSS
jgi:C4-type Zn-finger protein